MMECEGYIILKMRVTSRNVMIPYTEDRIYKTIFCVFLRACGGERWSLSLSD
jgi:hypothetical protein